jgi:hypothetical protein
VVGIQNAAFAPLVISATLCDVKAPQTTRMAFSCLVRPVLLLVSARVLCSTRGCYVALALARATAIYVTHQPMPNLRPVTDFFTDAASFRLLPTCAINTALFIG